MRALVLTTLMVMVPFAGAFDVPPETPRKREVILYSDSVWDAEAWASVREEGYEPLRLLGPNRLLAWGSTGDEAPDAEWRPGLEVPLPTGPVRILLEPRLPHEAASVVLDSIQSLEPVVSYRPSEGSPLPMIVEAEWYDVFPLLEVPGIMWVEPILETGGRNDVAAGLMTEGMVDSTAAWDMGLNGSGITIAYADTGLDRDHSCFRNNTLPHENATGIPGDNHRKIQFLNETLDDWDHPGHADGRHGTHIAGTLACSWIDGDISTEGTSLTHASRLVVQDIVDDTGWIPPDVDWLLWEALTQGAVIHSDSWGDDTTEYTARTFDFDAWSSEVPWSLVFVAPGNNGQQIMEPANARSVVAVSVASKTEEAGIWQYSSVGETHDGRRGIHITTPGSSIVSARADGVHDSYNNGTRSSTGSSMATPTAASFTAILQQIIEEGYFTDGSGFTPSSALLRALLATAAETTPDISHGRGTTGWSPDNVQGWGWANLSRLINLDNISNSNVWIQDSYRMDGWQQHVENRVWSATSDGRPLDRVSQNPWNGSGAVGPFLATGDIYQQNLSLTGEDLIVRLSWSPRPEPAIIDDLRLSIRLPDGSIAYGDDFSSDGSSTLYQAQQDIGARNETTVGINIPAEILSGHDWVNISVEARFVNVGNHSDMLGVDGDRIGFGLVVKGVKEHEVVEGGDNETVIGDPFDGMVPSDWGELDESLLGFRVVEGVADPDDNHENNPFQKGDFNISGGLFIEDYLKTDIWNLSVVRATADSTGEELVFRLFNTTAWKEMENMTWMGGVEWGDALAYQMYFNDSYYIGLEWRDDFHGNITIDILADHDNVTHWLQIPIVVTEVAEGRLAWIKISGTQEGDWPFASIQRDSERIVLRGLESYNHTVIHGEESFSIGIDPTFKVNLILGFEGVEQEVRYNSSQPIFRILCSESDTVDGEWGGGLDGVAYGNFSIEYNEVGIASELSYLQSSCLVDNLVSIHHSQIGRLHVNSSFSIVDVPTGFVMMPGWMNTDHPWFDEDGFSDVAPDDLECAILSEGKRSSYPCEPGGVFVVELDFKGSLVLNWTDDDTHHSHVIPFSLYTSEEGVELTSVVSFDWDGQTYIKWENPLEMNIGSWPVLINDESGVKRVELLDRDGEVGLESYCGSDVYVWWRRSLTSTEYRNMQMEIVDVGSIVVQDDRFSPYVFNFSENWVVVSIEEKYMESGHLNVSITVENQDNGLVIRYNQRSWGNLPYPDAEQDYLKVNVNCPYEPLSDTFSSTSAIVVGGLSALALVAGIAMWRKRRIEEVVGVPDAFVGSTDLSGVVVPSDKS